MRSRQWVAAGCLIAALSLGVAACGSDDDSSGSSASGSASGGTIDIYSSLPLQGASRPQTTAMVNGIKLALQQANNKAGDFTVKYTSLDDSTAQAGNWTPEATSQNARKVCQDDKAGVYIGEFNSGASAVSIPILNECGMPQISPANTAVGLTTDEPGADKGEPDKYYPTGKRTYTRIVPIDTIQGAALATTMKQDGCTKVAMTNDKEVYGAGLSRNVELAAQQQDLNILFNEGIDPKAPNYRSLASKAKGQGADCFIYAGITANNAVQLYKDFAAAIPGVKMYGGDGVAESGFVDPKEGGLPTSVSKNVQLTVATLSPDDYPPQGQEFFSDFEDTYGEKNPDPYAIYGYEAMNLALDAIQRAGSSDKEKILEALFATKDRESVLGTYSIDENGDTTLTDYGLYTVDNGELKFDKTIKAETGG